MRYLRPVLATLALTVTLGLYFAFAQPVAQAQGGGGGGQAAPPQPMSFFVTSTSKGEGANYGGLAGADAFCQQLSNISQQAAVQPMIHQVLLDSSVAFVEIGERV